MEVVFEDDIDLTEDEFEQAQEQNPSLADKDAFDIILHLAFDQKPLTRRERAENVKKRNYLAKYEGKARQILETLLDKYADGGVRELESESILDIPPLELAKQITLIQHQFLCQVPIREFLSSEIDKMATKPEKHDNLLKCTLYLNTVCSWIKAEILLTEDLISSKPMKRMSIETKRPEMYSMRPWPKG